MAQPMRGTNITSQDRVLIEELNDYNNTLNINNQGIKSIELCNV